MLPPPSRNGEKPPSRNGEIPPSRNGMKPPSRMGQSRQGDRPSLLRQELPLQHIAADTDSDLTVSNFNPLLPCCGRHDGLVVSAPDSASRGRCSCPGQVIVLCS